MFWLTNVTLKFFENWTLCLARIRFHTPFQLVFGKNARYSNEAAKESLS